MSRKHWSEQRRREEIERLFDVCEKAERMIDHLSSPHWQEPYPKPVDKLEDR